MSNPATHRLTFLVLGGTGGTGKHFIQKVLAEGHQVRALVRTPSKLPATQEIDIVQGSITDPLDTDALVRGVDYVVAMVGDLKAQQTATINTAFVKRLVPSMRNQGVKRLLYQSGGFSRPYKSSQSLVLASITWIIRNVIGRSYDGQHLDNEAVNKYLVDEAMDIEWMIHRAGISGDGPSKGTLARAESPSVAPFTDVATYNYKLVMDDTAVHTNSLSAYVS